MAMLTGLKPRKPLEPGEEYAPGGEEAISEARRETKKGMGPIMAHEMARWQAGPPMPEWMPQYLEIPEGGAQYNVYPTFQDVPPGGEANRAIYQGIYGYVVPYISGARPGSPGKPARQATTTYNFVPTRFPVKTPSLQQVGMMTPTQQAMLGGYAETLGEPRRWSDILAHVEAMRPEEPRGGRGRRYTAARSW